MIRFQKNPWKIASPKQTKRNPKISLGFDTFRPSASNDDTNHFSLKLTKNSFRKKREKTSPFVIYLSWFYHLKITKIEEKISKLKNLYLGLISSMRLDGRKVIQSVKPAQSLLHAELKGYLRYKTITYQNVSSGAQVKNFFILWKSDVPFSRYSGFCIFNHLMTSRWVLVHKTGYIFEYIFWTTTH